MILRRSNVAVIRRRRDLFGFSTIDEQIPPASPKESFGRDDIKPSSIKETSRTSNVVKPQPQSSLHQHS